MEYENIKGDKIVPVLNWLIINPLRRMGEWRCNSTIIDLSISRSWVVSFTLLLLCPRRKCPMCMRLGGPHNRSGPYGGERNLTPTGNRTAVVKLSLCLTNWALCHEGVWGNEYIDPHFLDLGTIWMWVVSFTQRPLYSRGKSPHTHWIRDRVYLRVGPDDVKKRQFFTLLELKLRPLGRPARSQSLYRLRYPGSLIQFVDKI
jgi:hypothetical protein